MVAIDEDCVRVFGERSAFPPLEMAPDLIKSHHGTIANGHLYTFITL